jgi:hypothetical protein
MASLPHVLAPHSDHFQDIEAESERCPTCHQPVSHEQFEEIRARIEAQERKDARDLEDLVAGATAEVEAQAATQIAAAKAEAAAQLEAANKATAAQLLVARDEATKAAHAALAPKLTAAEEAKNLAERQLTEAKAAQDTALNKRLAEQREALEADKVKAVQLANAEAFKKQQKVEAKLAQAQRQLQSKTADELGEGAEVDLFEALRGQFPGDGITRVKRGEAGADIIHDVVDNGAVCGRIVYDSKNRNAWQNAFVDKLRSDQIAAKADHAVLTTSAFPAGARQLHLQDGVIVTNPARAIVIALVLRKQVLQLHTLRVSNEARDEKTSRLYEFITSDQFAQRLDQIESLTSEMLELDVKEKKAHDTTWTRRGTLLRSVQKAHGELSAGIDRIVGQTDTTVVATG